MRTSLDRQFSYRVALLGAAFAGVALFLVIRLIFWQTRSYADMPELEPKPATSDAAEIRLARGAIWDHHGRPLALEVPQYQVKASPNAIEHPEMAAQKLAPLVGVPWQSILSLMANQKSPYVLIARDVPSQSARAIEEAAIHGIGIETVSVRIYPMGSLACHVLGFVNAENRAYYGVEQHYDALLRGRKGNWGHGAVISPQEVSAPVSGSDLVLTIEWPVQQKAEELLREEVRNHGATGGTIIVVDPRTGAIITMANWPTYDPNNYASSSASNFLNPAVSETYEPGSVIKPFLVAAALQDNLIEPDTTYHDTGCTHVMGVPLCNWAHRTYGRTTITEMLQHSLNVGAIHLVELLGAERFYGYLDTFGFGHPTGVDLAGEANGVIRHPGDPEWSELTLATNSYGQGMTATPLQVVMAMAAVANQGILMRPYVVERQHRPDGHIVVTPPTAVRRVISQPVAQELTDMLVDTVEGGIHQAKVTGYRVAGKTGTSQIPVPSGYDPEDSIATFAGFGPAEDPRFVILVKIDRPRAGLGGDVAAPVFRSLAGWLFDYMGVPPSQ